MIVVPRVKLLAVLLIPLAIFVADTWFNNLFITAVVANLLIVVFAVADVFISKAYINFSLVTEHEQLVSIGRKNSLNLEITNKAFKDLKVTLKPALPDSFEDVSKGVELVVTKRNYNTFAYTFRPVRRGAFLIEYVYYKIKTASGLFQFMGKIKTSYNIEVYPDIKKLNHFIKLLKNDRTYEVGINKNR